MGRPVRALRQCLTLRTAFSRPLTARNGHCSLGSAHCGRVPSPPRSSPSSPARLLSSFPSSPASDRADALHVSLLSPSLSPCLPPCAHSDTRRKVEEGEESAESAGRRSALLTVALLRRALSIVSCARESLLLLALCDSSFIFLLGECIRRVGTRERERIGHGKWIRRCLPSAGLPPILWHSLAFCVSLRLPVSPHRRAAVAVVTVIACAND